MVFVKYSLQHRALNTWGGGIVLLLVFVFLLMWKEAQEGIESHCLSLVPWDAKAMESGRYG